jgi:hypothetical protein
MACSSPKYAPPTARFPVRRFGSQAFPATILSQADWTRLCLTVLSARDFRLDCAPFPREFQ